MDTRIVLPSDERMVLLESWGALVHSGFPIQSSISSLRKIVRRPSVRRALLETQRCIDEGATLAQSLRVSRLFPPSWISLVELGEQRGDFVDPLKQMLRHSQEMDRIRREFASMLLMPGVVLALAVVWVWVYLIRVVPSLLAFAETVGGAAPLAGVLAAHSGTVLGAILMVLLTLLILTALTLRSSRADQTMGFIQTWIPNGMPALGPLISKMRAIEVCSELRLQLEAGIPAATAVRTLSESVPHAATRRDLEEAYRRLRHGQPVSEALEALRVIPLMGQALLMTGDSCGRLPQMLEVLVRETALDLTEDVKRLTIVLRNLLVLATGLLVCFLVISGFTLLSSQVALFRP